MKIGIIGGGPAGMMAAIKAAESGAEVTIFEKNEKLGKKLFITGKGRCNLCNDCEDADFFDQVVRNANFLYSSFYTFPPFLLMQYMESLGVPLKVERGRRVFPKSDRSSDIIRALEKELSRLGVKIIYNAKVETIYFNEDFFLSLKDESFRFNRILIATGGFTYPNCGATGDGYKFAEKLGHNVVEVKPGLVGIRTNHYKKKELAGLSLRNIELKAEYKGKKESFFGDLLFTHYGVSGPSVLSLSSKINRWNDCNLTLDLKPALSRDKLEKRIIREVETAPNKNIRSILDLMAPKSMVNSIISIANIESDKKAHQLTREERDTLVNIFKDYPLDYKGLFEETTGIISSGGVDTLEINPSSLESKIQPGLFFAGEVLDVDALTGGYNLQIAFSTGFLAGSKIGQE